ncbi:MAG: hypothetical protein B7Y41_12940 [Hydrogenophilales bacterium 28-61-23]|nr:MAG: hypothetical protein B7Y41_12940 [Hydrogenophilales bacterium 28-61-23]
MTLFATRACAGLAARYNLSPDDSDAPDKKAAKIMMIIPPQRQELRMMRERLRQVVVLVVIRSVQFLLV